MLVSSHVLADLEAVCDHVIFMEQGKTTHAGPLADVTKQSSRVVVRLEGAIPDLTELRAQLPQLTLTEGKGTIIAEANEATSAAQINAALLSHPPASQRADRRSTNGRIPGASLPAKQEVVADRDHSILPADRHVRAFLCDQRTRTG